ncbi:hypothetical protein C1645_826352 [Glomus cerebriforme]|uniref:Uncharacterized protein n=1 Tax=Glomus cerebriforme TaxID=658196 RepID=A0A397SZV3_9GLOM|nr:hypothetical protein C1645_826352 [Glomus cerebriforme]
MQGLLDFIIAIFFWFLFPANFFQKFSITTNDVFEDINNLHLPAANIMMEHSFRKVANTIQRSPAFELHGCQISTELRQYEEKMGIVGHSLKEIYSKGSKIYESIDKEIEKMIIQLDSGFIYFISRGDARYFEERINVLITVIKEFKQLVNKGHSSIHDLEEIKYNNKGNIEDGLRGAEDCIRNGDCDSKYVDDITKAKKELKIVYNIFDQLDNTKGNLNKMNKILTNYEANLMGISAELYGISKFTYTRVDLKRLRQTSNHLKNYRFKFLMKSL